MPLRSLGIWKQAVSFHVTFWKDLLPVFPLLCLPVVGDALHSLLIRQKVKGGILSPGKAVREVWKLLPSLLGMKLYFEGIALLWGFIPIYGIIQGFKYRLYWAMASNVLVFENLSGEVGRERCRELVKDFSRGLGGRTLITVPILLYAGILLVWVISGTFNETIYSYGFLIVIAAIFWVFIPASGAVNTFLYLEMIKHSTSFNEGKD
jgi:hypothetical protein